MLCKNPCKIILLQHNAFHCAITLCNQTVSLGFSNKQSTNVRNVVFCVFEGHRISLIQRVPLAVDPKKWVVTWIQVLLFCVHSYGLIFSCAIFGYKLINY